MNKTEAIQRVEKSKEDSDICVAEFPRELRCEACKMLKKYLFVFVETGISMEVCGACYGKLERIVKAGLEAWRSTD